MEHQKYEIVKKTSSNSDIIQFTYASIPFIFNNDDNLVYTTASSDYLPTVYYYCLRSDCKYICEVNNDVSNPNNWMKSLVEQCYEITSRSISVPIFNKVYEDTYKEVKGLVTDDNGKRILSYNNNELKENDDESRNIKGSGKGYYYEDIKQTINSNDLGYYKGYFLLDNKLTIIEQTGATRQENVLQIKLVKELNIDTRIYIYIIII